ncbi:geranylgeranylglycerol-phosphate geranylgeranyltransferase [Polluticoccus soli]|uniref:geranylgeranylglycerol-phosphate geranylgeranyltransferase n=1 Tax=Polluticoccus soli TaxID=3034150 RepID=UPI0023E1FC5D|nr:geranylgeranylglycerol-phosphate geranylgeranyltransferase [Flavipsychrobacter sp. JY13-12]
MAWLKLVRWYNLVIIFLTQLFAWGLVILPMQQHANSNLLLSAGNFFMLAVSTVLIAAAGYIINDYFDIKIDAINRPDKVVLEKRIPLKSAIVMHTVLNVAGIILALVVARRGGHYSWVLLQLVCTGMLWFYSTHLKRQFMSGNITVALLSAFTITALMLYEPALHGYISQPAIIRTATSAMPNPVWVLGVYIFFAFMLTWMREIVKDMEDFKGDAEQGCVTMPIKWGLQKSEWFTQAIGVVATLPLLQAGIKLIMSGWTILGCYTLVALVIPLIIWMIVLGKKTTQQHYHSAATQLKGIMVAGILSLIIYYIEAHA